MPQIPGLLGDQPFSDEERDAIASAARVPGLLSQTGGDDTETPEQAAAAIRNQLQMLDRNRLMAPESGYAARSEPIWGGPAYMGQPATGEVLSPAERQYWEDYATGINQTEIARRPEAQDPGMLARIAREAQRVAPMPPASGPGGVTYPLYQSPNDLYQALQMNEQNFNTWATRRAQQALQNPIPGGMPDPIPWRYNRSDPYNR